jgi:hemerythrin-like domain-containing protein
MSVFFPVLLCFAAVTSNLPSESVKISKPGDAQVMPQEKEQAALPGVASVTAVEDLMMEHGVLNRLLLIYEEINKRLDTHAPFSAAPLKDSAKIIRDFIEGYHEKLEEEYIFSRCEQEGDLLDLVNTLREQHNQGRILTTYIIDHSTDIELKNNMNRQEMKVYLQKFIDMYRPHEAREDTVLFPEFKKLVTQEEYDKLGEIFAEKEQEIFGKDGFNTILDKVALIEKELGIYNLSQFNPSALKNL